MRIPFNKPHLSGRELEYITEVFENSTAGNGIYTKKCHTFFSEKFKFKKSLLTTSCTDALEMTALLIDIQPGDEVIIPSYTFVSSALAYVRQGAKIVFADSRADQPNIDENKIEALITSKTKAIVVVHYAGVACEMDTIMDIAKRHNIYVIEDAAQAINSYYKGRPLGSIGDCGAYSFHETKNIQCGEGGLLIINNDKFLDRAEILWEKGTNRAAFYRGEVDKYGWVDTGSSFLPSDITAAFLFSQLEMLDEITKVRLSIWDTYYDRLKRFQDSGLIKLPLIPEYSSNNAHMFYLLFKNTEKRQEFIDALKEKECLSVFHYLSLHKSEFYKSKHDGRKLENCDYYADCLVRLPMYFKLYGEELEYLLEQVENILESM